MEVYKNIEKRAKIYGLAPVDLGLLLCGVVVLIILGNLLELLMPLGGTYYLFLLIGFVIAVVVLRRTSAMNNPSFLMSWISYYLFQPNVTDDDPHQTNDLLA